MTKSEWRRTERECFRLCAHMFIIMYRYLNMSDQKMLFSVINIMRIHVHRAQSKYTQFLLVHTKTSLTTQLSGPNIIINLQRYKYYNSSIHISMRMRSRV